MIPATFIYALKSIPTALRLSEDYMRAKFKADLAVLAKFYYFSQYVAQHTDPKMNLNRKYILVGWLQPPLVLQTTF